MMNNYYYKLNNGNGGDRMHEAGNSMMGGMGESMNYEYQYLSQMKSFISKAYRTGKYCDLSLKTKDGVVIQAHKLILASQCKYFMQKLDSNPDTNELTIPLSKSDALKVIIDYIYTQKIKVGSIHKENAKDVLDAGELFKIEDVKEEAAIIMAKNLNEEIAVDLMTDNIFAGAVANNACAYTANNFQLFLNKEHLKKRIITEVKPGLLCHLLTQKNLMLWDKNGLYLDAVEREKQIFFFVMGYIAHDIEARMGDLKSILTCLKLPLLIHAKIMTVTLMGVGLKKPPEVLAGLLGDILDPYEKMTGKENLATMFASSKKTGMAQSERRMFADTCKMRYGTISHTCMCSDVSKTSQPWAEKITFCPAGNDSRKTCFETSKVIRSVTVYTANLSVKDGDKPDDSNQFDRRVAGIKLKYSDDSESSVGETEHHTVKQETYEVEEGELVTEVHCHYPTSLLSKKGSNQSEIFSLTDIYDLSFVTSKERRLGPMAESDFPLDDGLTLKIPTKIKHLEKNCPGNFYWLQGFGSEEVKILDKGEKRSLFPVWGFKAHFKVYSVKDQQFEFAAGFKKHYQFSIEGLTENPLIDDLEDLHQLEKSPVHEIVDLDEESEESDSESEQQGTVQGGAGHNDDSIMVVDSDDDNEEDESDEEGGYHQGMVPHNFPGAKGGEDEPIEIESSSDEEENESGKDDKKEKEKENDKGEKEKRKRKESGEETTEEPSTSKKAKDDE